MKTLSFIIVVLEFQFLLDLVRSQEWATSLLRGRKLSRKQTNEIAADILAKAHRSFLGEVAKHPTANPASPGACPTCSEKDYSEPCPLYWLDIRAEGYCQAPLEYNGICNKKQVFHTSTSADKEHAESTCSFCWPCKTGSQSDPHSHELTCERLGFTLPTGVRSNKHFFRSSYNSSEHDMCS